MTGTGDFLRTRPSAKMAWERVMHRSLMIYLGPDTSWHPLAWYPGKVTAVWENCFKRITCLAGLLWVQSDRNKKDGFGHRVSDEIERKKEKMSSNHKQIHFHYFSQPLLPLHCRCLSHRCGFVVVNLKGVLFMGLFTLETNVEKIKTFSYIIPTAKVNVSGMQQRNGFQCITTAEEGVYAPACRH